MKNMRSELEKYIVTEKLPIMEALQKIDANKLGFVIVIDEDERLIGVLTDGDIRRGLIRSKTVEASVEEFYTKSATAVRVSDGMEAVIELFKNERIKFVPIVDDEERLTNIVTKPQIHALLLQDIHADLTYDFMSLDTSVVDQEIFQRPWGYYKTTVLNDYFQGKIISVNPGGQLSLQSHNHREEHWIVVHGNGTVQLDDSIVAVSTGSSVFIPKGCRHRLTNTDAKENLIITEVQIGDYFGEDDIIRYEDVYGRV